MKIKLPYGVRDGIIRHISEVENGLKCDCTCPACGWPLIARNNPNNEVVPHFAHYKKAECKYATETALHFAAKDIIEKAKSFKIPSLWRNISFKPDDEYYRMHATNLIYDKRYTFIKAQSIPVTTVTLEKKVHDIVPDIIIHSGSKILLVEIYVTHKVDVDKLRKIEGLGISTIEIDLSEHEGTFDRKDLENLLLNSTDLKRWIYNNKVDELRAKVQEEFNAHIKKLIDKRVEEGKKRQLEWEQKKALYHTHQKPIRSYFKNYPTGPYDSYEVKIEYVEDCPKKRQGNMKLFGYVHRDCKKCEFFRGFIEGGKFLVCLCTQAPQLTTKTPSPSS